MGPCGHTVTLAALCQGRSICMDRMPRALCSSDILNAFHTKKTQCQFYNACLTHAVENRWGQFGCDQCHAYQEIDAFQKMQDLEGLQILQFAADHTMKFGNTGRKRGVKPGVDAKGRHRIVTRSEPATVRDDSPCFSSEPYTSLQHGPSCENPPRATHQVSL